MKFGCMGKLHQAELISKAGFDRLELYLSEIMDMSSSEFAARCSSLRAMSLDFHVCAWIFPVDLDITSPDFVKSNWYDYISLGADRCAELGVKIWPFGTGKGRSIKAKNGDELSQQHRVADFLAYVDQIISTRNIMSAIEPLGPANSNYIQTLSQADALRKSIGSKSIKLMCDLRHMVWSDDDFSNIPLYADNIIHCHIDYPLGTQRLFPEASDNFDYSPYLRQVCTLPCQSLAFEAIHSENTEENMRVSLSYIKTLCK